jgi:hypothetical protein
VAYQICEQDALVAAGRFPLLHGAALAAEEPNTVNGDRNFRVLFARLRRMVPASPADQLSSPGPLTCFGTFADHRQRAALVVMPCSRSQR